MMLILGELNKLKVLSMLVNLRIKFEDVSQPKHS